MSLTGWPVSVRLDRMIEEAKEAKNFTALSDLVALKNELFPPTYYTAENTGPIMKLDVFETDEGVC